MKTVGRKRWKSSFKIQINVPVKYSRPNKINQLIPKLFFYSILQLNAYLSTLCVIFKISLVRIFNCRKILKYYGFYKTDSLH